MRNFSKKKKTEIKNNNVKIVCDATGWDEETAIREMDKAKKNGMTYYRYAHNECWKLSDDEIKALAEKLEKQAKEREENIKIVCEATGWDKDKAKAEMDKARENGMTYYRYAHNECWKLTDEEIKVLAEKLEEQAKGREENIKIVCEATGWDKDKAKAEMDRARQNGMPYYRYVQRKCWQMSDDEIKVLADKLNTKAEAREKNIAEVCMATGWDKNYADQKMKKAAHAGISYKKYVAKHCYDLNDEEIEEFGRVIAQLQERRLDNNDFFIHELSRYSGWNEEKCVAQLNAAKDMGISYLKYLQKGCWVMSEDELKKLADVLARDKQRISDNKNKYIQTVCNATGWSWGKAELEINKAKVNCGSSYEDYCVFKLYDVTPEEQRQYVTLGLFDRMRIKYNDHFKATEYFDDKAKFNETFSDLIHHRWFVNRNLSYGEFEEKIKNLNCLLVKPLAATQGMGIHKVDCNIGEKENRELYEELMKADESIIEEYIVQHDEMMKICPTSVNTVRVTTINYNGECRFLYSVFRMGQGAVVDNFHAGGIAATVDIETGIVCTDAADLEGNTYAEHPVTKVKVKGFRIPHWEKILDACRKATGRVKGVDLVGWDFAVTNDGVELIEGNSGASYVVAQIPNIADRIGLRSVMADPYL